MQIRQADEDGSQGHVHDIGPLASSAAPKRVIIMGCSQVLALASLKADMVPLYRSLRIRALSEPMYRSSSLRIALYALGRQSGTDSASF